MNNDSWLVGERKGKENVAGKEIPENVLEKFQSRSGLNNSIDRVANKSSASSY